MNEALYAEVLELLFEQPSTPEPDPLADAVMNLIDAACRGQHPLDQLLDGLTHGTTAVERVEKKDRPRPPGVFLDAVTVSGFRGVGPKTKLKLRPGPGLTLIVGRNGSGKSSFADGLEIALTGRCSRWAGRNADWRAGWRNLHHAEATEIDVLLAVEDGPAVGITQRWKPDADLNAPEVSVRRGATKLGTVDELGWNDALSAYRPFLSYTDLGMLVEEPSRLFDSMQSILGLEELTQATKRVGVARANRDQARKEAKRRVEDFRERLEALVETDERAKRCLKALKGNKWKLEVIDEVVLGVDDEGGQAERLRALAKLVAPAPEAVARAVDGIRAALAERESMVGTSAAMNAALAKVLDEAIRFHDAHGGDCPVCERTLEHDWSARAKTRVAEATELARRVNETEKSIAKAVALAKQLIEPPPRALAVAAELELPTHALAAWTRWADAPTAAEKLAEHMQDLAEPLRIAVTELVAAATARLETLDTVWRPLAAEMAEWLPSGKRVLAERDLLDDLKHAEAWLKDAEQRIQARRLEPLQSRSVEIWEMLRQQSNVSLASVTLSGRSKRRRVDLDVQVDGETSIALGVMSQGELNSLALSLFLPRMTLPDSPFHFMVIDDPVQAMDPHKVDGLARVLDEVAKTRQVVIFTHDTRLQEAVRRLKIDATILEVQRDTKSRVRVVENDDAVTRYLRDANTVATKLSKKLVGRALPGHCRGAIEAACLETIRRRRLGRGDRHADVDFEIAEARRVFDLLALALFDDRDKGGQVFGEINRRIDAKAADNLRYCKEGVHGNFDGDPFALIEATTKITKLVRGAA